MLGTLVALEVDRSDVVGDGPVRFSVDGTLVLLVVPPCRAVDGVDEDDRHRLKQDFRFGLNQFAGSLVKTRPFQEQAVDVDPLSK